MMLRIEGLIIILSMIIEKLSLFYVVYGKRKLKQNIGWKELLGIGLVLGIVIITLLFNPTELHVYGIIAIIISLIAVYIVIRIEIVDLITLFFLTFPLEEISTADVQFIFFFVGQRQDSYLNIIDSVCLICLIWLFYIMSRKKIDQNAFVLKTKYRCVFSLILLIIAALYTFFTLYLKKVYVTRFWIVSVLVIFGGIIMVFVTFALIYNSNKKNEEKKKRIVTEIYNGQQKRYFKELLDKEKATRQYRHDVISLLVQIDYYLDTNRIKEARDIVSDMLDEITSISYMDYDVGNEVINTMLNYYLTPMREKGYRVEVSGYMSELDQVSKSDMCVIISNLLKNACEAVNGLNIKDGNIKVHIKSGQTCCSIVIENSTLNREICTTSKDNKKNHGFGLKNVKKVIDKYDAEWSYGINDNKFVSRLIFNY